MISSSAACSRSSGTNPAGVPNMPSRRERASSRIAQNTGWLKRIGASSRGGFGSGCGCGEFGEINTSRETLSGCRSARCTAELLPAENATTGSASIPR
ncbi:MAG: hypothetical protein WBP81_25810 [Solirubrobacteraceae bacterium]